MPSKMSILHISPEFLGSKSITTKGFDDLLIDPENAFCIFAQVIISEIR